MTQWSRYLIGIVAGGAGGDVEGGVAVVALDWQVGNVSVELSPGWGSTAILEHHTVFWENGGEGGFGG